MRPAIGRTPWRSKLMEVVDPFANRLRFDEPLESLALTAESHQEDEPAPGS